MKNYRPVKRPKNPNRRVGQIRRRLKLLKSWPTIVNDLQGQIRQLQHRLTILSNYLDEL